ncbi:MAG: hypothetical protein JSR57_10920 [Verrucomicrobia bacterium]|nr:hypothetical protein [Verrucomicrobiota bacterium]
MKTINALTTFILFFSIPTMSFPHMPEVQTPHTYLPQVEKPNTINLLSYDDIVSYIERIEHEDLENICNPEDLSQLNLFVAQLAEAGLLSEDGQEAEELHDDIQELLNSSDNPYSFAYSVDGQVVVPAMLYGNGFQTTLCKSWVKKACHKIKKFVKKHKNEILVGAAVVVTVVVVVVTVGAATGAAVAGAAAAAADSSSSTGSSPTVQEVIEERVADFKEAVSETIPDLSTHHTPESFGETVRKMGSVLAHETLDGVAAVAAVVPGFMQEVSNTGQKLGFDTQSKAVENFEKIAGLGHEYIDAAFSTQLAEKYAARQKASLMFKEDMKLGIIPIAPGAAGSIPMTGRVAPTQANGVKGWISGQPIQNLTSKGNVPKWSTVRQRHWKNRAEWAKSNPGKHEFAADQLKRMENGLAPQRKNQHTGEFESMELHHDPAQRDGGLFDFIEVWPDQHAAIDALRQLGD